MNVCTNLYAKGGFEALTKFDVLLARRDSLGNYGSYSNT